MTWGRGIISDNMYLASYYAQIERQSPLGFWARISPRVIMWVQRFKWSFES